MDDEQGILDNKINILKKSFEMRAEIADLEWDIERREKEEFEDANMKAKEIKKMNKKILEKKELLKKFLKDNSDEFSEEYIKKILPS